MSFTTDLLIQVGSYLAVLIMGFIIVNFLTKGFLLTYIKVKASRGKKILLRINSLTGRYYKPAVVSESTLKFKDRQKTAKTLTNLSKRAVFDELGVKCVEFDEETRTMIDQFKWEQKDGNDPAIVDDLLVRALQKPVLQDKKEMIIIILNVLVLVGIAVIVYFLINLDKVVKGINVVGKI